MHSFLQATEDLGLRTYDALVLQNASDVAREDHRLGHATSMALHKERLESRLVPEEGGRR